MKSGIKNVWNRFTARVQTLAETVYQKVPGAAFVARFPGPWRLRLLFAGFPLLVVGIAGLYFFSGSPLRPENSPLKEAPDYSTEKLSVIQATPTGKLKQIDLSSEIVVVFNKPMIPLSTFRERSSAPIIVKPEIEGNVLWHGSRVAALRTKKQLSPGTKYTIQVPAGTKSLDGSILEKNYNFQFTTPPLKVQGRRPYSSKVSYDEEFRIYFNYQVSPGEAKRKVRLLVNGKPFPARIRFPKTSDAKRDYRIKEDELRKALILVPAKKMPRDAAVVVEVQKGMKPDGGNIGTEKTEAFSYRTYGPLRASLKNQAKFYQQSYGLGVEFNNPVNEKELEKAIQIFPPVQYLRKNSRGTTSFVSLRRWDVKPGQEYRITLSDALKDSYGNRITGDLTFRVSVPQYRKSIYLESGINHIEARGPRKIPVDVEGVDRVQMEIGSFDLDDVLEYAASKSYRTEISTSTRDSLKWDTGYSTNEAGRAGFDMDPYFQKPSDWIAVTVQDQVQTYNGESKPYRQTRYIQSTDLGMVTRAGKNGYYTWLHSLSTGKPVHDAEVHAYSGTGKIGSCETDDAGFCRIEIESPQESRHLVFFAKKGEDRVFITGKRHSVSLWSISPHYRSNAHLPSLTGQIVFDRKLYRPGESVQLSAYVAMWDQGKLVSDGDDLGDFRLTIRSATGDTIYDKTFEATEQGNLNAQLTLPDKTPLGHYTVSVQSRMLDGKKNSGDTIRDTFQVEEFKPVDFSVEWEKIPASADVGETIQGELKGEYLFGAPMQNANAKYRVNQKVYNPYFERKRDFFFGDDDYGDRWDPPSFSLLKEESGKLDPLGKMKFLLKLSPIKPEGLDSMELSRSYTLELEGAVRDVNDRTVHGRTRLNVFAGKTLPGIRIKDRYKNSGEAFEFDLTAVSSEGNAPSPVSAEVVIHRKEWKTIQSKSPGDTVQRRSVLERKEVYRATVSLSDDLVPFTYTPDSPGQYSVTVRVIGSLAYTRMNFHAFGAGFIGWNFHNDDSVSLVPDRTEYRPGDTAKILIQSPFRRATAIVTLEREGILWQKSYPLEGNGQPIEVPITEDHVPNVYVSVMLVRPRVSNQLQTTASGEGHSADLGRPKLAMGVVRLNVDRSKKRIPLTLKTNRKSFGPGDEVSIEIRTEPRAEVTLGVADRGVLDLINYRFKDPLDLFYDQRPHGVSVYDNRKTLIERMSFASKGSEPGGKGWGDAARSGEGGFSEDSEDGVRKDFRYTAYWSPTIRADRSGVATLKFKLPHNLTTFRIQAIAAKDGRYNTASKEFQVKKDIVVRPLLPRFIRPGDRLETGALVTNQTEKEISLKVAMKTDLLKFSGPNAELIRIGPGESKEISFPSILNIPKYLKLRASALEQLKKRSSSVKDGAMDLEDLTLRSTGVTGVIEAMPAAGKDSSLTDRMSFSFPVVESPPVEAFAVAGATQLSVSEGIKIPSTEEVLSGMGTLEFSLASTAMTGLTGAFHFYRSNPYFCLEQRASAFLVRLSAGDLLTDFDISPPPGKGYRFETIEKLFLDEIKDFQNQDGGFKPWKESSSYSSPYLTAYVAYVLQAARKSNQSTGSEYAFDSRVYEKAIGYLKKYVQSPPREYRGYLLESLSLIHYVLTMEGEASSNLEAYLLEKKDHLSLRARGYLALSIAHRRGVSNAKSDEDLKKLMQDFKNRMQFTTDRIAFQEDHSPFRRAYYSDGSVAGVLLRVFMKLEPDHPAIPKIISQIMADRSHRYWQDSHSTGVLAHSLLEYRNLYEKEKPDFKSSVHLGSKELFSTRFTGRSDQRTFSRIALDDLRKIAPSESVYRLKMGKEGKGRLYYRATLVYSPAAKESKPMDQGIEVRREILSLKNPGRGPLEAGVTRGPIILQRGEVYLNRITVTVAKPVYDFLYRDPLASGVENVNAKFQTESSGYGRFLQQERNSSSNRMYYWTYSRERMELRDDAVLITKDYLSPGVHEFFYLTRATIRGKMQLPAAEGFGMYEPFIMGRTGSASLVIQ